MAGRHLRFSSLLQLSTGRICVTFIPAGFEICGHTWQTLPAPSRYDIESRLNYANLTPVACATRIDESAWRTAANSHKYLLHVKIICKYRRVFVFVGADARALYLHARRRESFYDRLTCANWDRTSKLLQSQSAVAFIETASCIEIETVSRQRSDGNVAVYKYGCFGAVKKSPVKC